jgi:hypothetical protein
LEFAQGAERRGEWLQVGGHVATAEHGLDRGVV